MNGPHLDLIPLDQPREGYRRFIACWLARANELTFIVDPGPASTATRLLDALRARGVSRVDYVLGTHVHLDHTGAAAQVLEAFPAARFHCHERGVPHVVDPRRLWRGSLDVLGEVAEMYGAPRAVAPDRVATDAEIAARGVRAIPTPGHAPHHLAYLAGDVLFAGEAFGATLPLPSGEIYLRPATPPRFFLGPYLDSIDRLAALEPEPARTAFAHFGERPGVRRWAALAREQIVRWVAAVDELVRAGADPLEPALFERLMRDDPLFGRGRFDELDADLQARERHFLGNALEGIAGAR